MPTVTSRISRPASGCQVRSRWSSSSCGSRRLTARIIISTYSAMGSEKTPRALVMSRAAFRPRRRQDPLDAGGRGVDPAQPRRASQEPVEDGRRQRPAEQHLDVVERRRPRGPRARRSRGALPGAAARDALQVRFAVARRQDGRERDGRGHAAGSGTRPGDAGRLTGCALTPEHPANDPRDPAVPARPSRASRGQRLRAAPQVRRDRFVPPAAATPATNRSPRRYCSSLRSSPVSRAIDRSIRRRAGCGAPRTARGSGRRPAAACCPTSSMTQSLKPSSRLITRCVSRNRPRCSGDMKPVDRVLAAGSPRAIEPRRADALGLKRRAPRRAARELALEAVAQVRPQPRVGLELERVGRLVERDPDPEVVERHAQGRGPWRGCSPPRTAARPGALLGRQQRDVVLAEHARAEVAEQEADLAGGEEAVRRAPCGLARPPPARDDRSSRCGSSWLDQRLGTSRCWRAPSPPGRRPRGARRRRATG